MSTFTQVLHVSMHTSAFLFTSTKLQLRHLHLFFFFIFISYFLFHYTCLVVLVTRYFSDYSLPCSPSPEGEKKHVSPNVSPLSSAANFF